MNTNGRELVALLGVTAIVGLPTAAAAEWAAGPGHLLPAGLAAVGCLVPAAVTLSVTRAVAHRPPPGTAAAVALAGGGLRGLSAVVLAFVGGDLLRPVVPPDRFARWLAGFYVLTLAAETAVLVRVLNHNPRRAADAGTDQPPTADRR